MNKRLALFIIIVITTILATNSLLERRAETDKSSITARDIPTPIQAQEWRTVVRVVDGDTLELDGKEKVRLLGVDTPEKFDNAKLGKDSASSGQDKEVLKSLGRLASEFTKKLCEGKKVTLEYDSAKTDMFGRTLAYAHLEDGTVVNEAIIKNGYGGAYTKYKFKYKDSYVKLEIEAKAKSVGMWSTDVLKSIVKKKSNVK
jgi:micrococcal nuclease